MNIPLIERLQDIISEEHLSFSERFEKNAETFYRATGHMAPGKSAPLEMYVSDEAELARDRAWDEWNAQRKRQFYIDMQTCVKILDRHREFFTEIVDIRQHLDQLQTDATTFKTAYGDLQATVNEIRIVGTAIADQNKQFEDEIARLKEVNEQLVKDLDREREVTLDYARVNDEMRSECEALRNNNYDPMDD